MRDASRIELDRTRVIDKNSMAVYMDEIWSLPDYFGGNLDSLYDCLSEYARDVDIVLERDSIEYISTNDYAYNTVTVLSKAAQENPHLRILIE